MPGLRDIKRRLQTVKNIRKITYAMKLVSTAKLKKSQEAVVNTREYTTALRDLIQELRAHAISSQLKLSHPLMQIREEKKKICLVVIGGSRGLCGGYNTNLNKKLDASLIELQKQHPSASFDFIVLGKKPAEHFRRVKIDALRTYDSLSEDPYEWPCEEVASILEQGYSAEEFDEVYLLYTKFKSAISVTPVCDQLLPIIPRAKTDDKEFSHPEMGDIIFEPSPEVIFNSIIPKIINVRLLQAGLDAKASEHGSRMTAMDSATKNGDELVQKLQLLHNKLRQGSITTELLDIIGGSNALE